MKNVIKKISAIAMAFTILGTGTTVAKTINPKSDNIIVADAANNDCKHNWRWYESYSDWEIEDLSYLYFGEVMIPTGAYIVRYRYVKCVKCGKTLNKYEETKWVSNIELSRMGLN